MTRHRLFSDAQLDAWASGASDVSHRYRAASSESCFRWVQGVDLSTERPIWAPAQFVHLGIDLAGGEPMLGPQVSTGLALGPDPISATLAGALECVERDAFMLTWELRRTLDRVDPRRARSWPSVEALVADAPVAIVTLNASVYLDVPVVIASEPELAAVPAPSNLIEARRATPARSCGR